MVKKKKSYLRTPRYGRKVRLNYNKAKEKASSLYECPKCGKKKVKRIGFALWQCSSCKATFAGAAYELESAEGKTIKRMIKEVV